MEEATGANADGDDFDGVLRYLRSLAAPCEPPVGVGTFDVRYASADEVVVWYSPAREEHTPGEVTIPCARLESAWKALRAGETLDEPALERLGIGPAGGRWLLAVLAQLPGVQVRDDPIALSWASQPVEVAAQVVVAAKEETAPVPVPEKATRTRKRNIRLNKDGGISA